MVNVIDESVKLDFLGQEIKIGSHVIFIVPKYREITIARVYAFTPENIRLEYQGPSFSRCVRVLLQHPSQVIVVDSTLKKAVELNKVLDKSRLSL